MLLNFGQHVGDAVTSSPTPCLFSFIMTNENIPQALATGCWQWLGVITSWR